jgi:signal transduction histidine kinase
MNFPTIKFEYKFLTAYLMIGGLWILFSDRLLHSLVDNNDTLSVFQTYKGWFYVLVSALIFYYIIRKHVVKLRAAEQQAVKSNHLKTMFIQNISHEVRTPMNGIVGFSDLLGTDEEVSQKEYRFYVDNIIKNSKQLLAVIDNVLEISIIDSGNIQIKRNKLMVDRFLEELERNFTVMLKTTETFRIDHPKLEKPLVIITDELRLRQIFNNLIGNAIKFTQTGEIVVGYQVHAHEVMFFVKDNGIGISPENQAVIFERFKQSEGVVGRYGGTGLGLAITKELCTLLGGRIWVESQTGKGSVFYFTLPL